MSTIFPGAGQIYALHPFKGGLMAGATLLSIGQMIRVTNEYNTENKLYSKYSDLYIETRDLERAKDARIIIDESFKRLRSYRRQFIYAASAVGLVYLYNLWDIRRYAEQNGSVQKWYLITPEVSGSSQGISFNVAF